MKISELSKKTGVSQRMLRHFEQQGLLEPERNQNAYRTYNVEDQKRILEIREWQRLGLTKVYLRYQKPRKELSKGPNTTHSTAHLGGNAVTFIDSIVRIKKTNSEYMPNLSW